MSDADVRRGELAGLRYAAAECRRAAETIARRSQTKAAGGAVAALLAAAEAIDPDGPQPDAAAPTVALREAVEWAVSVGPQAFDARSLGYTGDECRECGSMRMVRNGTCLKCENCGATTGCS